MTETFEPVALLAPQPLDIIPAVAAGRLPVMAFVDANSERLLQESSLLPGRTPSAILALTPVLTPAAGFQVSRPRATR